MPNLAVFLDRDGVINDNQKPVNKPSQLILFEGAGRAIKKLNDNGYEVFVVTNQGGVGLGYMTEADLHAVHQKMLDDLAKDGAVITEIVYCPHKPHAGCPCRKPKPKMILDLAKRHDIDLKDSYMVGDRDTDVYCGQNAGTKTIFIGKSFPEADHSAPTLVEAVEWILQ